ncbi:YnfA family protein [Acinetobacter rathckeae]|uniref:YnfA family protein n=1 Tax=Acinetobacter rathckeae TaxID=2605272 RepID=UPI0018A2B46D|nr:YnfA family protein [Acinetobacter rathckeae]MBF7687689.1 YnfA family protein [Acinetobacter rathckeae]
MDILKILSTFALFFVTAIAEILGCYFPYLMFSEGKTKWLWVPTAICLLLFVWLLTLHPAASGRIYAAYGGIYIFTALLWLRFFDNIALTKWYMVGGFVVLCGAFIIILQPNGLTK